MQALLSLIAEHIGKPVPQLMNNALRAWTDRNWKGNARELRHCLEQAVTLNDGPLLTGNLLRLGVEHGQSRRRTV